MTDQIILTVPEDISELARELGMQKDKSAEQILLDYLASLTLPALPIDEQAELDALKHLSDDALRTIAQEQMPDSAQSRAHTLMDKNGKHTITDDEYDELQSLVERADRLMVRKAEAAAILQTRGNSFTQQDFLPRHE
jgi:hypothetical protein